mmetsp:Transcript_31300/g.38721  ORF Transcript_31300/g.38721 Transcript_31300/m.38721 type:complete len:295 (-) Transcript_31300:319-1203(-)
MGDSLTRSLECLIFGVQPLFEFAKRPDTLLFVGALCADDAANAVLHAIDPLSAILAPIRVGVRPLSMLFVKSVIAFVLAAILPDVVAVAVHDATLEATLEVAPVGPLEAASAAHLVVRPMPRILGAVCPKVHTFALLDTVLEVAVVVAAVGPHFDSFTILLVLRCDFRLRLDRVEVVLDIKTDVLTEDTQVRLPILLPEAFVNFLSLGLGRAEDTQTACLPIDPVTFKAAAIGPNHLAVAALRVLVVDNRVITLLRTEASLSTRSAANFAAAINGHHAHLAHVLEGAELHGLEG